MGMGIGAAMTGLRPIVEGMNMGFLLLAYNQISNNAGMLHYTSGGQYKVGRCWTPAAALHCPQALAAHCYAVAVDAPNPQGRCRVPSSRAAVTHSIMFWAPDMVVICWPS